MDDQIICAYLWQDVIRLGFCPVGVKNQASWLHQYNRSLKEFWEIDSYPEVPKKMGNTIKASINCGNRLNLCLEYAIDSEDKFNVRFLFPLLGNGLMWVHDVDRSFFTFPVIPFLVHHNQRKTAVRRLVDDTNIAVVVDSLLLHPAAHQHVESPITDHEIRIGGGIDNPFLYLFHLRYQLCPIEQKRKAERTRLIDLFSRAVKSNSPIPANVLLMI